MLTLDLQIIGQRHKDLKNGMSVPPKILLSNILDMMTKPAWGLRMLGAKRRVFGNIVGHVKGAEGIVSLSNGRPASSIPRSTGRTSPGSRTNGAAS